MTDQSRLPSPYGRLINREKEISFLFEGKPLVGFEGDTIGSALLGSGRKTVSRSFKYHRPRGFLSLSGYDANGYVQLGGQPNVLADLFPLTDALPKIEGQNRAGSVEQDRIAWMKFAKRFLPVGFYYRSFFKPAFAWPYFERLFRSKAGLGKVDKSFKHKTVEKIYLHTDVVIVGAGRAGLAAALEAAENGADVILVEMMPELGGAALYGDESEFQQVDGLVRQVTEHSGITVLKTGFAQGLYQDKLLSVEAPEAYYKIRTNAVVLATGAYEQPLIFRGNDLPGVMLSSAARRLLWLYGIKPGAEIALSTVNDHGLETALQLVKAGAKIVAVADLRSDENRLHKALREAGARIHMSSAVYEAVGPKTIRGRYFGGPLEAVRFCHCEDGKNPLPFEQSTPCDLVIMSGGYTPAAGLACHSGTRLAYDERIDALAPGGPLQEGVFLAGAATNFFGETAATSGRNAGRMAARYSSTGIMPESDGAEISECLSHAHPIIPHPKGDEFVDFDEDLTIKDIKNAVTDGFSLGELLKRYSTAGMGPSQGRQAAVNVLRIAAEANGIAPSEMGTTTVRPPLRPESFAHLAGPHFHPTQLTPIHKRHEELGAVMMPAGSWLRPAYYGDENARQDNVIAEVSAVREAVGIIDVSTLGKIEVTGPDAAAFLDKVYLTSHSTQKVGRSRYAIRCGFDGSIVDDGVVCRFDDQHFYLTTTTGQAVPSYRHMTWLNAQWGLDVDITNVTSAFGAINIAGPKARTVVSKLATDIDFGADAFPYIASRTGRLAGASVRVVRVGFVGELGYEIHLPARYTSGLWDLLLEAGNAQGIKPFGVLAQRLLRLEKGHVIVGQDTDGLTLPSEANMAWAIPKKKKAYCGRAAIEVRSERKQDRLLVGFALTEEQDTVPPECALIVDNDSLIGRVTSAAFSEHLGRVIGLCFLPPEQASEGTQFQIKMPDGELISAEVVPTPFYDPGNERQKV